QIWASCSPPWLGGGVGAAAPPPRTFFFGGLWPPNPHSWQFANSIFLKHRGGGTVSHGGARSRAAPRCTAPGEAALLEQLVLEQRARAQTYDISLSQQGLWLWEQLVPGSTLYNVPWTWRLDGPLDLRAFHLAFHSLITRHATLRS